MNKGCIFLALAYLFFPFCTDPCDCYSSKSRHDIAGTSKVPWKISVIDTKHIAKALNEKNPDNLFGIHFYKKNEEYFQ